MYLLHKGLFFQSLSQTSLCSTSLALDDQSHASTSGGEKVVQNYEDLVRNYVVSFTYLFMCTSKFVNMHLTIAAYKYVHACLYL